MENPPRCTDGWDVLVEGCVCGCSDALAGWLLLLVLLVFGSTW